MARYTSWNYPIPLDDTISDEPFLAQRKEIIPICRVRVAPVECLGGITNYQIEILPDGKWACFDWNWKVVSRFSNEYKAREEANWLLRNKYFTRTVYVTDEVRITIISTRRNA